MSFALRLTLLYLVVTAVWVWLSDYLVRLFVTDPALAATIGAARWWLLVFVTAAILYTLLNRKLNALAAERKQAEATLRESEQRFRMIADSAPMFIWMSDASNQCTYVNQGWLDFTGQTLEQALGRGWSEAMHPDDQQRCVTVFERAARAREAFALECRLRHSDGDYHWILDIGVPRYEPNGTFAGYVGSSVDVTERRLAEEALRDSRTFLEKAQEVAHIGSWTSGIELDEPLVWSKEVYRIFGIADDTPLTVQMFFDAIHPDDLAAVEQASRAAIERNDAYNIDHRIVRPDETVRWVSEQGEVIRDADGRPLRFVGVIQDMTERKRAEEAQRRQQELLQTIVDYIPVMIVFFDADGQIQMVNREWERVMGWTLEKVQRHGFEKLLEELYPEAAVRQRVLESISDHFDWLNFKLRLRNGDMLDTLWANVHLADGRNMGIGQDITELKRAEAELRRLNDELEERVTLRTAELRAANERLLELDELRSKFVAHVSHELRNPVASLYMRLFLMERSGAENFGEHMRVVMQQVERLKNLIEAVLDLSRLDLSKGKVAFEPVDFNAIVRREVAAFMIHAQDVGLKLAFEPVDETLVVWGERNQLAQVVTNLVSNAIRYTPRGEVSVTTTLDRDGYHVCLHVADTGLGIDPNDLPHLFERFYRGRTAEDAAIPGTGLGLSIVKEIVELHEGSIEVESEVGRGTTFRVCLPLIETVPA